MSRADTKGFVLIELMVGIALGLIVVATAVAATAFTLAASAAGRDSADLQQRADSVLRQLGDEIRHAGGIELEPLGASVRFSGRFLGWQDTGPFISGVEGGPGQPDILRLSAERAPDDRDCLGNQPKVLKGQPYIYRIDSEFTIAPDPSDNRRNALYCKGPEAGATRQSLVSGVDDLQVSYGLEDASGNVRFVDASALSPASRVRVVSVCLQMSSQSRHGTPTALDCNGRPIAAARLSGRLIRLARGAFMLRNAPA